MTKTVTTGKATDLITFTRSTTGTYLGSDGLLKTADTNEPRIEYDADGNLKGLLIEEQRTNLVRNSDYSNAFDRTTSGNGTFTVLNENKLGVFNGFEVASGGQSWHRVNKYVSVTSGTVYAVSFYYRYGTSGKGRFECRVDGNSSTIVINQSTGSTGTGSSAGGTMEFLSDEAFGDIRKLTCRWTPNATSTTATVGIATNSEVVGETIIAYAVQLETGTFPTSYIPTSGSTATRNADVASINLSEFEYNHTESTILVEGEKTARNTSSTGVFTFVALHDGGTSDRVLLYYNNNILRGQVKSAHSVVAQLASEVAEGGKLGLAYKENDVAFTSNGGTVNTDTSAAMPAGLNTLAIGGYSYSTGQELNGYIKSVKYYPVRLTDNQLKALTQ